MWHFFIFLLFTLGSQSTGNSDWHIVGKLLEMEGPACHQLVDTQQHHYTKIKWATENTPVPWSSWPGLCDSQIRPVYSQLAGTGPSSLSVTRDGMLHIVGSQHLAHISITPHRLLPQGMGLRASLLSPLPCPKHLVKSCWILPTSGTILQLNVKSWAQPFEKVQWLPSQPFPSPLSGCRCQLEVLDCCLSSGANHSVGEKGLRYRGELSLFEASVVLALQRGRTPSLVFRITFDHCYSPGSDCQSGQSISHGSTARGGPACPWCTSDFWALQLPHRVNPLV